MAPALCLYRRHLILLYGILIVLTASCTRASEREADPTRPTPALVPAPVGNQEAASVTALENLSRGVAAVASKVNQGVVLISTARTVRGTPFEALDLFEYLFGPNPGRRPTPREPPVLRQEGLGSGFFTNIEQGLIMTSNHVVEGADEINVKLPNGRRYPAKVVGRDARTDIALVKISSPDLQKEGAIALAFADSQQAKVGDFVVALGAPFGLEASVSFGVVSAIGRGNLNITELGDFIQTDAAINPGNSGGPLVNIAGQVVGVNTAIFSRSGGYNGIGFAVPSNLARRIADELIKSGKVERGYLGVQLQPLDPSLAEAMRLPEGTEGVLVANVAENSPARASDLQAGDIITRVNETPVRNASDLANTIGLMLPNTKVKLTLLRDGKSREVEVTLGSYPEESVAATTPQTPAPAGPRPDEVYGLSLAPMTESLARQHGLASRTGLIVEAVQPGSASDQAGLKVGDVILTVNHQPVSRTQDFWNLTKGQERVLLRVERQGNYFYSPLDRSKGQS
ncbi:Do family serine endopeptidase [Oligoflexus tunisiensis]|uniref:Do family serine endopeptidase n=1 Tax=Oligoflexus tunisiensis TaxID=708132 RepID=UPI00114D13FC|nr:Do family serine endopeptidase [Oligoflexus tunisiensis]